MAPDPSVTVGGVTYRVTPEYLAGAATDTTTTASEIERQLAEIKSFVSLMAEYDILANMLHQALTGIAGGLHGNYINYTQSEQQNLTNLAAIEASMPGGPGAAANLT
jgi:hypothetical protein